MMLKFFMALILLGFVVLFGLAYWYVPEDALITLQWGLDGEVNNTTDKWPGILILPLTAVGISFLLWLLPKIEPRKQHLQDSKKVYYITMLGVQILLLIGYAISILQAMGHDIEFGNNLFIAIGILFIVLGNYLPKVRSNFFLGIRTPWTLSSEIVWNKTHRIGGYLFMIIGAFFIVASLITSTFISEIIITCAIVLTVIPVVYSWWIFSQLEKVKDK